MENLPIRALESGGYFCENIQQMRAAAERNRVLRPALLERKKIKTGGEPKLYLAEMERDLLKKLD